MRALWHDTRALVRQSRASLLAFGAVVGVETTALHWLYVDPQSGRLGVTWARALHATLKMMFLETVLEFPERHVSMQLLFLLVPAIGLLLAADGIVRFSVALFYRRERKEAWQVAVASTYSNHVVICGLGRIGYRVVRQLLRLGEDAIGIERNEECPFLDEVRQMKVPVLVADARQRTVLEMDRESRGRLMSTKPPGPERARSDQPVTGAHASRGRAQYPLIAIVGPCAAGKSSVVRGLQALSYNAREVAQEHSHVPAMWHHITAPDILVYLDVSYDVARQRRPSDITRSWWERVNRRLQHARAHADFYVQTDDLAVSEIVQLLATQLAAVLSDTEDA